MCNFQYGYQQYFKWNEALVQHYFARGQAMILLYVDKELLEEIGTRAGIKCHDGWNFQQDFYFSVEKFCETYTYYVHNGPLRNHQPCTDYLSVANDIITYKERNRRVFIFYPQRIDYIGTRTEYGAPYTLPFFSIIIYMLLHFDGPNVERWQWDNLPDHVAPDWQSREYIQSLWNELHKYNNGFDKKASVFAPRNDNRQDHIGKVMYHLPLSPSSRRIIEDALYQSNSWQLKDRISFYEMAVRIQGSVADNYVTNEINDIIRGNPVKQRKLQAIIEDFDISEYLEKLQERNGGNAAAPAIPKIQGEFVLCINIPDDDDPYIGLRTTINQAVDAGEYHIQEGTDQAIAGLNRFPVTYNGGDRVDIGKYRIGRRNGTLRIIKNNCDDPIFFYEYGEDLYIQTEDTMMPRPYIVMVRNNGNVGFEEWCKNNGNIPNIDDSDLDWANGWILYYCNKGWNSQYYQQNVQANIDNANQSFELRGGMGDRRDRYYINALPYIKVPQQYIGRENDIQLYFGVNGRLIDDGGFTKTIVGNNIILDINDVNEAVPYCDLTVEIDNQQTHFDFDLSVPTIHYENNILLRYGRLGERLDDNNGWANYGNYVSDNYRKNLPNQNVWRRIEGASSIDKIDETMYLVNLIADHCSVSKKFSISNEEFKRCVEYASRRLGLDLNQDDLVKKCKKVLVEAGIANYAERGLQAIPPTFTKVPVSSYVGGTSLVMLSGCYNRKFMSDLLQFCKDSKVTVYAIANRQNHEDAFNRFIPPIVLIDSGFKIDVFRKQYCHEFDRELDYDFALSLLNSAADLDGNMFQFAPGTQQGLEESKDQYIPRIRHDTNPDYCKHWYIERQNNQLASIDKSKLGWASLYCARERNSGNNVFMWKSGMSAYISSKVTLPTPIKRALFLMNLGLPEECKAFVCDKKDIGLYLKVRKYSLHTQDRLNLLISKVTGDNINDPVHFRDRIQSNNVRIELWKLKNRFTKNRLKNLLVFYDNNEEMAFGNLQDVYFNVRGTFCKVDAGINELFSFLIQNNGWQLNDNVIAVSQNDNQRRFVVNNNAANRNFPNRDEYEIESLEIL